MTSCQCKGWVWNGRARPLCMYSWRCPRQRAARGDAWGCADRVRRGAVSVFLYCYECHRLDDVEPAEPVLGGRACEMSGAKSFPQARGSDGTCATCYALSGIWAARSRDEEVVSPARRRRRVVLIDWSICFVQFGTYFSANSRSVPPFETIHLLRPVQWMNVAVFVLKEHVLIGTLVVSICRSNLLCIKKNMYEIRICFFFIWCLMICFFFFRCKVCMQCL